MVGTFLEPSCGRGITPIHSIPYSVAQPLERGFNNYYSIIQGRIIEILSDYDNRVEEFNAYICFNDESERKRIIDQFEQHAQEYLIVDSLSRIYFKTNDPIQIAGQETVLLMQNQSPLENIFVSL